MHESSPYHTPAGGESTKDLLRKLWTRPQATLRYILARCPDEHVALLVVLGGIARAVGRAASHYPGSKMSGAASLVLALAGGSLSGMLTYTAYAWGLSLAGGWLGGKASSDQFKTVLGWALVSTIASLVLLLPTLAVLSGEAASPELPLVPTTLRIACGLAELVLGGWSTVILLRGVALIQGFSVGRSLLNVLLPGALLLGGILLLSTFW